MAFKGRPPSAALNLWSLLAERPAGEVSSMHRDEAGPFRKRTGWIEQPTAWFPPSSPVSPSGSQADQCCHQARNSRAPRKGAVSDQMRIMLAPPFCSSQKARSQAGDLGSTRRLQGGSAEWRPSQSLTLATAVLPPVPPPAHNFFLWCIFFPRPRL